MGASTTWPQPPAYGRPLIGRRKAGERIGLLVVAVHDESAGHDLASRPNAARVAVLEDALPHELDWSCAVALDCIVVGDCSESLFYATVTMLYAAGAATIWRLFDDGLWRMERWQSACCPMGFYAADGPYDGDRLGVALATHRSWALMRRAGVYGTPIFEEARTAEFSRAFGPAAAMVQQRLDAHLGFAMRAAA